MFDFLKPKPKQKYVLEEPEPSNPLLFEIETSVVGEDYHCKNDPKMARSYWIKQLKLGQHVGLEQYRYQGKPAICVTGDRGLDVANLSEPFVEYLAGTVSKMELRGEVTQVDPLRVLIRVYGVYKKSFDIYDETPSKRGKEYTYRLKCDKYLCYPPVEVCCECEPVKAGCAVSIGNEVVDFIDEDRGERLKKMLQSYDCITTIEVDPQPYSEDVKMILRF